MADLQQYEYHADLLRTIPKAVDLSWFEDSDGLNGLHCLAEVSLKLLLPGRSLGGIQPGKIMIKSMVMNHVKHTSPTV